jgi:ribosomal protein L32
MAVQQNKKSPSKRGMHRSHNALNTPGTAVEATTGESAPAPPHQPERLLPWPQGAEDQGRRLIVDPGGPGLRKLPGRGGLTTMSR